MIDAIRLKNFRGFRDVLLELKGLTVLVGPNSSGKSSFGHAISAMAHAHRAHTPSNKPSLSPLSRKDAEQWPIDLGGFADLRTNGVLNDRVCVGLRTTAGWIEYGFGLEPEPDLRLSYLRHPLGVNVGTRNLVATEVLNPDVSVITEQGPSTISSAETLQTSAAIELYRINEREWRHGEMPAVVGFEGLVLMAVGHAGGTDMLMSGAARDDARSLLEGLTYLRATRERPMRGYAQGRGDRQAIGYSGEWTSGFLKDREGPVRYLIPPMIPTDVESAATADYTWAERDEPLIAAVSSWLRLFGLAEGVEIHPDRADPGMLETRFVVGNGQPAHDITEVGLGLSQLLPVLAAGLAQPRGTLFIVDLPEAHLHPRPQAALADFFCSLALSNRFALVETHSEMFFHRLRLRAAMNPELMDNIAVYFLDPPCEGLCSAPRRVGLGFDDELRWPPGFLQEAWEVESQIHAVRSAKPVRRI